MAARGAPMRCLPRALSTFNPPLNVGRDNFKRRYGRVRIGIANDVDTPVAPSQNTERRTTKKCFPLSGFETEFLNFVSDVLSITVITL